jgi:hypothetical protein
MKEDAIDTDLITLAKDEEALVVTGLLAPTDEDCCCIVVLDGAGFRSTPKIPPGAN